MDALMIAGLIAGSVAATVCALCWSAAIVCALRGKSSGSLAAACLGSFLGMVLGLSESPVLSAVLVGALALVGQIAVALKNKAISVTPPPSVSALFAALACFGAILGITLRANDLLSFTPRDLRSRCIQLGFTEDEAKAIMARLATSIRPAEISDQFVSSSVLMANETKSANVWQIIDRMNLGTEDEKIEMLRRYRPHLSEEIDETIENTLNLDEAVKALREQIK